MNDQIKAIEKQAEEVERLQETSLPRISELKEQIKTLEDERSKVLIAVAMGETKNGTVKKLTAQIEATRQELEDTEKLASGLQVRKADLAKQEKAIRLGLGEGRYRELVPQLEKLQKEWYTLRKRTQELSVEINAGRGEASRLFLGSQELRRDLGMDYADLPNLTQFSWQNQQIGITTEQLKGEKGW